MTKLKDVLHFYLGCKVESITVSYDKHTSFLKSIDIVEGSACVGDEIVEMRNVKPILRKLSSITEDEKREFIKAQQLEELYNSSLIGVSFHDEGWLYPKAFIWAISKGFDLFDLIDSSQAIDASTLKQKEG